ncbi:MAG TPA: cupin domain-containing protein [Methyloceanibacter sp.]
MEKPDNGSRCWLDPMSVPPRLGSIYPAPFADRLAGREKRALGDALRLTQFGVNLVTLPAGAWSSQRHWHAHEDEFIYVLQGEVTLVTDTGQKTLKAGMAAGFPAGKADGHHLINQSDNPALYLEVGTRAENEVAQYSDIDMVARKEGGRFVFTHKNGDPYS